MKKSQFMDLYQKIFPESLVSLKNALNMIPIS
jgi:hypothetical protein